MSNRKQRVVLNGEKSTCENINAGVSQGSIIGPLLFLIYINDLSDGSFSKTKLLADDIFLFTEAHGINTSANELNNRLKEVSDPNPKPSKNAQEVIFSQKLKKMQYPHMVFNNANVSQYKSMNRYHSNSYYKYIV